MTAVNLVTVGWDFVPFGRVRAQSTDERGSAELGTLRVRSNRVRVEQGTVCNQDALVVRTPAGV